MPTEIRMPKLSDNMEEGTVIRWIVGSGDNVSAGDPIAEVETDKANVEIEAEVSGVVRELLVQEGASAAVGAVLAVLEGGAAAGAAPVEKQAVKETASPNLASVVADNAGKADAVGVGESEARPKAAPPPVDNGPVGAASGRPAQGKSGKEPLSSPVARQLAQDNGIDLTGLRGSGPGGRIVKSDVEDAIERGRSPRGDSPSATTRAEPTAGRAASAEEPMSRMRRTIAARMEKSKREIPHFYVRTHVDMGEAMKVYRSIREDELVPGLTITHLLLRAIALTLPKHPRLNSLWVDDTVQLVEDVNIGIVVSLDDGLLVPVVKRAQSLSLAELVAQARALTDRARRAKFQSDDLVGGTFSVSNIGMLDVDELTPIINEPQAAILGVGAVRDRAQVRDGKIVAGVEMHLTLACDHRVADGVEAGSFLQDLKHALENPLALVVARA